MPAAIRRARRTPCGYCGRLGASVGCMAKRCESSYHFACALAIGVVHQPENMSAWCPLHTPKRGAERLPIYCERSIRVKPLSRLQILPPWQRLPVREIAYECF